MVKLLKIIRIHLKEHFSLSHFTFELFLQGYSVFEAESIDWSLDGSHHYYVSRAIRMDYQFLILSFKVMQCTSFCFLPQADLNPLFDSSLPM